ncbi:MAG: hypothetical protein MJK04_24350, partial [Psychrosphaera sp.]|nr:hypothetical protein [Psychrosphaera sp.]
MRLIISLFILLFSLGFSLSYSLSVEASQSSIRFERLSIKEGLSISAISSIRQDRLGYLWFGTEDGLN